MTSPDYRRILLIKPSSLGDVVHALPVLHGLRRRFPEAHIAWLLATAHAPLLRGHPDLNEIIEFDRLRFGRLGRSPRIGGQFAAFVRDLRARRFDLAIDLQCLFRSGFLALASGAPVRIGFRSARELAWVFYTERLDAPDPDIHAVDKNYLVAGPLGFGELPVRFDLAVTAKERERAAQLLSTAGVDVSRPFVAVLPGARWDTKRWLPERFAEVIGRLATEADVRSVLLGAASETGLCGQIISQVHAAPNVAPVNLAGRTDPREMVAILDWAASVLCQDSAPAHLAAAIGRPLVCILGPTNSRRTGPYTKQARLIQADLSCVPCYLRVLTQCPHSHECIRRISVDEVVEAVVTSLSGPTLSAGAGA